MSENRTQERHCSVQGCERKYHGVGYCRFHYRSVKNHGDPNWEPQYITKRKWIQEWKEKHPPANGVGFIPIKKTVFAVVDEDAYEKISAFYWYVNRWGYAYMKLKVGKGYQLHFMHRLITGASPSDVVDHRNGNKLDNRKENLRFCTSSQNAMNSRKASGKSSIYKGVCWHKKDKTWVSYICRDSKRFNLGAFSSQELAAIAYNKAAKRLFGDFAHLNIVPQGALESVTRSL